MFAVPHEVLLRLQRGTSDRTFNTPFSALSALVRGKLSAESVRVREELPVRQIIRPCARSRFEASGSTSDRSVRCQAWLPGVKQG